MRRLAERRASCERATAAARRRTGRTRRSSRRSSHAGVPPERGSGLDGRLATVGGVEGARGHAERVARRHAGRRRDGRARTQVAQNAVRRSIAAVATSGAFPIRERAAVVRARRPGKYARHVTVRAAAAARSGIRPTSAQRPVGSTYRTPPHRHPPDRQRPSVRTGGSQRRAAASVTDPAVTARRRSSAVNDNEPPDGRLEDEETGGDLLSQALASQVPSALWGLTALFGMGRGVSPTQ